MLRPRWLAGDGIALRMLLLLLVAEAPLLAFTITLAFQNDHLRAQDALSRVEAEQTRALGAMADNLRSAQEIASVARSLPETLADHAGDCEKLLAGLIEANGRHVAAIALQDPAGNVNCATGASIAAIASAAQPDRHITGLGDRLAVRDQLQLPRQGTVTVALAPSPRETPAGPLVWLRSPGGWIPAGPAPAAALPRDPVTRDPLASDPPLSWRGTSADGRAFLYTVRALHGANGAILLAGSDVREASRKTARTVLLRIMQLTAFFIAESLLVAFGVHLFASRPLHRLNDAIRHWRINGRVDGMATADEPAEVRILAESFAQANDSLDQRERELNASIAQQELLMQEIHHRVKNNLQIVASLLNLQAARIKAPEARAEFQSARDRVRALATLHRHLYAQGELHLIDMRAFFSELCSQLFQALDETQGDRITLDIVAPDANISSDQAVPIALIVTETVGNAIKYAFPNGRRGTIRVEFETAEDCRAVLTVRDDGVGAQRPDGGLVEGLGLQLVRGFARQLGAQLTISTEGGTCYRLDMAIERQRSNTIALGKTARSAVPAP